MSGTTQDGTSTKKVAGFVGLGTAGISAAVFLATNNVTIAALVICLSMAIFGFVLLFSSGKKGRKSVA